MQWHACLYVGTGLDQQFDYQGMTVQGCQWQGCPPSLVPGAGISAVSEQLANHTGIACLDSANQALVFVPVKTEQ
jgi:hypothetical protein